MDKILITGGYGQLGTSLFTNLQDKFQILRPKREELNFLNNSKILQYLDVIRPILLLIVPPTQMLKKLKLIEKSVERQILML